MDQVRHTPAYRHTNTWHTNKVDAGGNYVPDPEGDAMTFLDDCIAKVEDYRNQNDSTVTVSIRFIVHLVGDMHCPGHVKYRGTRVSNSRSAARSTACIIIGTSGRLR